MSSSVVASGRPEASGPPVRSARDWGAWGQAADAVIIAPAPLLPGRTPLPGVGTSRGAASARAPLTDPAEAFVLLPPASPLRQSARTLPRRTRRRSLWMERLRRSSLAAGLPAGHARELPPHLQVMGMPVVQTAFDFERAAERAAVHLPLPSRAAALDLRARAGLFDAALVVLASALFFSLFAGLGGVLTLGRRDLLVYLLATFVLAAAYFCLFTLFGGRTPGMQAHGLYAASFESNRLPEDRALWRAFGYLVSIGSLGLGFLWAGLDDRGLTWHDHISQTLITDRPTQ
ncbi:MAG: RDD family protein [Acidobacteria bacterium]|nr:RDD family protein [Acidobacteriota bacterium]